MSLTTLAAIGYKSQLALPYTAGSGSMTLAIGGGAIWAGSTSASPGLLLVVDPETCDRYSSHREGPTQTVFACTGVTGDVLTGVMSIEGRDQAYASGSIAKLCTGTGSNAPPVYANPAFTSFGNGIGTPVEVGATIGNGPITFTWSTSNSGNVAANSVSITDTTASSVLASGLANNGTDAITLGAITNNAPAAQVWTIGATDTQSRTFTDTYEVDWEWRVYAGTSANLTLTANQIKALTDFSSLATGFAGTYSLSTGGYKYLAYPDSMGSVSSFIANNFPVSIATSADNAAYSNTANGWSYALVSVTNTNSVTTNYRVYRSQYVLGGALVMAVS